MGISTEARSNVASDRAASAARDRAHEPLSPPLRPAPTQDPQHEVVPRGRRWRVLQIVTRLNIGGPARHMQVIGQGLGACGFDLLVVHGTEDATEGSLADVIMGSGVAATHLAALGRRVRPWRDLTALWQLNRLIVRWRPDVVHTHTAKAGALGRLAAVAYNLTRRRDERAVIVHTFHGHVFHGYFGPIGSRAVRAAERALAALSDRIIAVSERQKAEICGHYRIAPPGKTDVLGVGADVESLFDVDRNTALRQDLGMLPHHVVFGYAGRFVPVKNLSLLVCAFARITERFPDARLVMVGDGELRGDLERQVRELHIGDRVRFTGWVADITSIYGVIDVAMLTSLNEGTPLVLLEAMAAGRPVIATAVGGVEDIVTHEQTGLIVPPADVDAVVDAMARLAGCQESRRQFGLAARREAAARFERDGVVSGVATLYTQLLRERRI